MKLWLLLAPLIVSTLQPSSTVRVTYPDTRKVDQTDDFFGTRVADPYRWLEDDNSAETAAWVAAENKVTFAYLEAIPARARLKARLTELWNYERFGVPSKEGKHYFYSKNDGLQNQAVYYKAASLDAPPQVLLDPNTLSADGTVALSGAEASNDGTLFAYATSASGSDWMEWHVRDVATATDRPDVLKWGKFTGAAWRADGSGFYYGRFDAPTQGAELQGANRNHKLYFHALGTAQSADVLAYARPDQPDWLFSPDVTDDGRFLIVTQNEGTNTENRLFVQDLKDPKARIEPFLDRFDAAYTVVGNDGDRFYVLTDKDAPRGRLVAIDRGKPDPAAWKTIIPQDSGRNVLANVVLVGSRIIATWRVDAHDVLKVYGLDGAFERDIALPTLGTVNAVNARRHDTEVFYDFTSFIYPTSTFRYDPARGTSAVVRQPKVAFDPALYETTQVFYPSKDGTKVPLFVTAKKGLAKNGQNPTLLYGYGGFNIAVQPTFSPALIAWLEMGGVYAVANLRGGSEYGKEWHDAGRLAQKQNVFDDFIAAAEYLIAQRYTTSSKLAINGGSNGGLLVGACLTQRPELFGATVPQVGVMDMLRFHRFTIGWAWKSDYGSAETKEGFDTLIKYSPLQNIKPGTKYPATLITTADHDDRVVPAHSFKFAAALQAAQGGDAPVLIRIETKAGHGAGKPTSKLIEEKADVYTFLVRALGMEAAGGTGQP